MHSFLLGQATCINLHQLANLSHPQCIDEAQLDCQEAVVKLIWGMASCITMLLPAFNASGCRHQPAIYPLQWSLWWFSQLWRIWVLPISFCLATRSAEQLRTCNQGQLPKQYQTGTFCWVEKSPSPQKQTEQPIFLLRAYARMILPHSSTKHMFRYSFATASPACVCRKKSCGDVALCSSELNLHFGKHAKSMARARKRPLDWSGLTLFHLFVSFN